jgi:hypothetical protein
MSMGKRNTSLHSLNRKCRHLPQLIEPLINAIATAAEAANLMPHVVDHFQLSLDQMREGARFLACRIAKGDSDSLTAETTVTLGHFKTALGWAYAQVQTMAREQQSSLPVNEAEAAYQEAAARV